MEKRYISRDNQELTAADINNMQKYTQESVDHIVVDAITTDLHYTGLAVTSPGGTDINVSSGRFYNAGQVYVSEQTATFNLYQYLPTTAKRIVAVVVYGETIETAVEPRDFLINAETMETEPQSVPVAALRKMSVGVQPGDESVDPQAPALLNSTMAVAYVTLGTTGIENIEMQINGQLPNLGKQTQKLHDLEIWREKTDPRISSIATDISALAERADKQVDEETFLELSFDLARLRERLELPDVRKDNGADRFLNEDESNTGHVAYSAEVNNGVLFPTEAESHSGLQLFNPTDPAVHRFEADNFILPKYSEVARVRSTGYSGDISISAIQTQQHVIRKYKKAVTTYHYGWRHNYYPYYYRRHWNGYYWRNYRYRYYYNRSWYRYSNTRYETHYKLDTITNSINGALLAQTMLVSNAHWLSSIGLYFTKVGSSGDLNVLITETDGGKPTLEKTVTQTTIPRGDLKKYPAESRINLPPVLLEAGKRYAVVLITQGDHRAAVVSGQRFTQGTLFQGTDSDYFSGDLTKDLMFTLYAAQFENPRTEVMLQSVNLAGGMTDLDITPEQVVPSGTELFFEIQIAGKWYRLDDGIDHLSGKPDIVPVRAVFLGTSDLAPGITVADNIIKASRPAAALSHISTMRTLATSSDTIQVRLSVGGYDAIKHTLALSLVDGASEYAADETKIETLGDDETLLTFNFTLLAPVASYEIKMQATREVGALPFTILERVDVAL